MRTAPSAGATYPLETYLCAANVDGLASGLYHYDPDFHALQLLWRGDKRRKLAQAAFGQNWVADAAAAIVFAAVFRRMAAEFGPRGVRLAYMEAGHAAQNVCLQATALGLSVIGLGRIDENLLRTALQLPEQHEPLYLLTIGRRWA